MSNSNNLYISKGICIMPNTFSPGDIVQINYDGALSKEGSSNIKVVIGCDNNFENASEIPMYKDLMGHITRVQVPDGMTMNLFFKDSDNRMDNNSDNNYCYDISK